MFGYGNIFMRILFFKILSFGIYLLKRNKDKKFISSILGTNFFEFEKVLIFFSSRRFFDFILRKNLC